MIEVIFRPVDEVDDGDVMFSVIAARYGDKWIFSRHRARDTWEIPGGHREANETTLDTARRELYEETGATQADFTPLCVYGVKREDSVRYGMLYFASISELDAIPDESEIAEIILADALPDKLTYPAIQPHLYRKVQSWLNFRTGAGELWDVYDADRRPTGRMHRRGDPCKKGDYFLSVRVWLLNDNGQFVITQRSANKGYPLMWETTGGAAQAGDDSLQAALREAQEETGLILDPACGTLLYSRRDPDSFTDVWLFRQSFRTEDVTLQEGETCDVRYASADDILRMHAQSTFVPYVDLEYNLEMIHQALND